MKNKKFLAFLLFAILLGGCSNPSNSSSSSLSNPSSFTTSEEHSSSSSNSEVSSSLSSNSEVSSSSSSEEEKFIVTVINGSGSGEFVKGENVTIVADTPSNDKVFSCWVDENENSVSTSSTFTFVVNNDVTLKATYVTKKVNVTVVSGTGTGEYEYGQTVTITPNPAEPGKTFASWMSETGELISREETYTFEAVEDISIYASYSTNFYSVNVTNGTITGTTPCIYNQEITVTAEEQPGKVFISWVDENNDLVSNENPYTFNVTSDVNLTATYEDVIISTFNKPESLNDVIEDVAKASLVQNETSSMTYFNNNNNSYGSTDLDIKMYANGVYATGIATTSDSTYASSYETTHIYKLEENKLSEVKDFAYSSSYYDFAKRFDVVETVEDDETQISTNKANELIGNYGMISSLSSLLTNFKETTTLSVEDVNDSSFIVKLKDNYDVTSTMFGVFDLSITFNGPDYYISEVVYTRKEYVKATQMVNDVLKDDAVSKNNFSTSYTATRRESQKGNLPDEYDITPYFIASFDFKGTYYEGSTSRTFDKDNTKIALGVKIDISRLTIVSGSILPTTALEDDKLLFVSSSDEEVIAKISSSQLETKKAGTTTLTVSTLSGVTSSLVVEIGVLPPTSLTINAESKVLKDNKIELTATPNPTTSSSDVTWSVDDESIASITQEDGKTYLLGKSKGYVTVTATSNDDNTIKSTKTIYVSEGDLTIDQLEELLVGTWYEKKSSYSDTGFKFEFNSDGTLVITDNYRSQSARISCIATWELTTNTDDTMTHNGSYATPLNDAYVINVIVIEMTDAPAYWMDMHLAISKDGSSLTYHFIPGSTSANTQTGVVTKIA